MNSLFYASYLVDLTDCSVQFLKGKEYATKAFAGEHDFKEVYKRFADQLVLQDDRERIRVFGDLNTLEKRLHGVTHIDAEYRGVFTDGWCQASFLPVAFDEEGRLTHVLFVLSEIDRGKARRLEEGISNKKDLEKLYRQYRYESEHDSLTGLYNRKKVFAECRRLLEAYPEEPFAMLHCDVQHFHLYNTFFGESGGDRLLCRIADVMRKLADEYDIASYGRVDSDVFCFFFPENRGLFEKHIQQCFETLEAFSPNFPLRLAIGVYRVADKTLPIETMYSYASIAAKSGRKNLFGLISQFDEEMEKELQNRQQITGEMSRAVAEEQFEVYLQPKYALKGEVLVGAEALVRWNHPEHGLVSPGKFIPVFEKNGFISELDRYIWEHVCQLLKKWKEADKPIYPVSVNISRVSMYSHETVPLLISLVEKYNIPPKYLELELTETAYMDDPEDLKRMLGELQEYGFTILMDDFGSGYSSLNTLRELPVDILKLDMKFLSDNDTRSRAVLSSIINMSKMLNLPIVAEGVETGEQAKYLQSLGCEFVQGFHFARPMPVAEYEKLIK